MVSSYIPPGSTLGVIGAGQLGRMFAKAALRLGYRVQILSTKPEAPALTLANEAVVCSPDDTETIASFAHGCRAVTVETESIHPHVLKTVARAAVMAPGAQIVKMAGDRLLEKSFLQDHGFPVGAFAPVRTAAELTTAVGDIGTPCLLKACRGGYDGKSQERIERAEDAAAAWQSLGNQPAIVEAMIDFQSEVSVIVARAADGNGSACGPIHNIHRNGILDTSQFPADLAPDLAEDARQLAGAIAHELDYVGVLCIELFVTRSGQLLVNEMAPRPHNSGHLTLEACQTDQFEQQVRMMCGLPPGSFTQRQPAAMFNLLGDLWAAGEPDWRALLQEPRLKLHLYGKEEARPGRKMGHLTALADTGEEAFSILARARQQLLASISPPSVSV